MSVIYLNGLINNQPRRKDPSVRGDNSKIVKIHDGFKKSFPKPLGQFQQNFFDEGIQMKIHSSLKNKVWGVYSDPYVRLLVRSSVCPSQTLIRYSSKTAEQNFMKLLGTVHYMMPYCTSYFKILFEWFLGFPEQNKDFAIQNMGEQGGIIFLYVNFRSSDFYEHLCRPEQEFMLIIKTWSY